MQVESILAAKKKIIVHQTHMHTRPSKRTHVPASRFIFCEVYDLHQILRLIHSGIKFTSCRRFYSAHVEITVYERNIYMFLAFLELLYVVFAISSRNSQSSVCKYIVTGSDWILPRLAVLICNEPKTSFMQIMVCASTCTLSICNFGRSRLTSVAASIFIFLIVKWPVRALMTDLKCQGRLMRQSLAQPAMQSTSGHL